MHHIDFKLSEKKLLDPDGEDNDFFMKRLYQRDFSDEELLEIKEMEELSNGNMYYDEMEKLTRDNARTNIGIAFADSLLMVIDFYDNYHHGYSMLDFHRDQILFDENGRCHILDILV